MYQEAGNWYSYFDFSGDRWKAATNNGYKPYKWVVPGDCANQLTWDPLSLIGINFKYTTGKEVMMGGENGAILSTMRGSSLNSSIPGMMCLNANMGVTLNSSGGSTVRMQGDATTGVAFRNTPEQFALDYNPLQVSGEITKWTWQLLMSNGSAYQSTDYDGSFAPLNTPGVAVKDINYGTIGIVSKYTLLIKAADKPVPSNKEEKMYAGGTISESSLIIENLRFLYNSTIDNLWVDEKNDAHKTTISGTNITFTI